MLTPRGDAIYIAKTVINEHRRDAPSATAEHTAVEIVRRLMVHEATLAIGKLRPSEVAELLEEIQP